MEDDTLPLAAVLAGVLAYLVAFLFEVASMKNMFKVKATTAIAFVCLQGLGLFAALWRAEQFRLPTALSISGWIMLPLFTFLFLYSLVIELPARNTYYKSGSRAQLVRTGTYALTRHPCVIWYILALVSLILATRSIVLLVAASVWSILNVIYAVVQDRFFFIKMFPGYQQYQKETPMLIPTGKSVRVCLKTLRTK